MKNRKFLYINTLHFDGAIFQTQIIDWLDLYQKNNVEFEIIHTFHIKSLLTPKFINYQKKAIRHSSNLKVNFYYYFSFNKKFIWLNTLMIILVVYRYLIKYKDILIFSRSQFSREIKHLKRIFPNKIIYIYDNRAAGAEEMKFVMKKTNNFSYKQYSYLANLEYIEYVQHKIADKIFVVSEKLMNYYVEKFNIEISKFILYPCLSTKSKFYLDQNKRDDMRKVLGFKELNKVFLYAGGIENLWHNSEKVILFLNQVSKLDKNSRFIIITKDKLKLDLKLSKFPNLHKKITVLTVKNSEMVEYLNAADYGILFRENTIMNNVASPTKFAEYMLCGLPTIISEGVGDFTQYCVNNNTGFVLCENVLDNLISFNLDDLYEIKFDRKKIAGLAIKELSKEYNVNKYINVFNNVITNKL